jgi:hydrogenase expression/formation protein HypC
MCLAVPGKILTIEGSELERSGKVSFGGAVQLVNLSLVPDAKVGDYVIVHVGIALNILDEEEAMETFKYLRELEEAAGREGV